jgi:xanthine/uracil permease
LFGPLSVTEVRIHILFSHAQVRSMRSARLFIGTGLLVAGAGLACSSDTLTDVNAPFALSLELTPSVDTIFVTNTIATATPVVLVLSAESLGRLVATPKIVEWTSSNPAVAVVTNGVVRAVGTGTTIVTARVNDADAHTTIVVALRLKPQPVTVIAQTVPQTAPSP